MLARYRFFKNFDWQLFIATIVLAVIGLMAIYSSGEWLYLKKQSLYFVFGLMAFGFTCFIDWRNFQKSAEFLYGFVLLLLIIVLNSGFTVYGAQRWLSIGGLSFQPSEIAKLALIIMIAKYLERYNKNLSSLWQSLPLFLLVGLPFFIIFKQPDLGTAIVLIVIFAAMLLWGGLGFTRLFLLSSPLVSIVLLHLVQSKIPYVWFFYLLAIIVLLIIKKFNLLDKLIFLGMNVGAGIFSPVLWNSLAQYQKNRLLSFFDPTVDPLARGVRYHIVKSTIAVGSGGFLGNGFLNGPLTQLHYIPQQHTDFIFSVIAEEFGLVGSMVVLGLFFFIIFKLIVAAVESDSLFGTLVIVGIATMLMFQFFVNIGMNIGMMPVVGLPLPFVSYGGSSLILYFTAMGIIQSIIMRKQRLIF